MFFQLTWLVTKFILHSYRCFAKYEDFYFENFLADIELFTNISFILQATTFMGRYPPLITDPKNADTVTALEKCLSDPKSTTICTKLLIFLNDVNYDT